MAKKKSDDEFSIDLTAVNNWFKKLSSPKNNAWLIILLILIPMSFSVYVRAQSYNLPVTDDWAYNSVYNSIRNQVSNDVNKQYPNLPAQNKNELIEKQVAEVLESQKELVDNQVSLISQNLKSNFQDDTGQTYLGSIDPYYFYRDVVNLLEKGHYGDVIIDGVPYDDHMFAPIGRPAENNLILYLGLYYHKFMSLFTDNSVMKNFFFLPILMSVFAVIPAFFIAKKRVGYFGGFVAAMIVAVHSSFLGRTTAGATDTDPFNVTFPLFIAWFFLEAFESDNFKKQLIYLFLGGLFVGIYSFAWTGWWYIFDFLIGIILVYIFYAAIKGLVQKKSLKTIFNNNIKSPAIALILFITFSGLFVTLITSFNNFIQFFTGPLGFTIIKQAAHANLWPNVYTTVAELNPASISAVIAQNGGKLLFFIACLGVVFTMIKRDDFSKKDFLLIIHGAIIYFLLITTTFINMSPIIYIALFMLPLLIGLILLLKDNRNVDIKYALFLTILFVGTIYASTKGVRFILLMVPAFAIALGIAFGTIQSVLSDFISKEFKINRKIASGIFIVLLLILLIGPVKAANNIGRNDVPIMNDAWWNTLINIEQNSSKGAIITSWWDYGHFFKAIADRAVTFDGTSQNTPQAHWVGKLLMTDSEHQAVGILRMLDCGANNAFTEVDKKYDDTEKSVDVVYAVIEKDRESAKDYLQEIGFDNSAIEKILSYTHCQPPEALFITSNDMVGKAGVWAHFGSWNFDRAFIYNNVKNVNDLDAAVKILVKRFNYTEDQAASYYYEVQSLTSDEEANAWIAPWPSYAGANWGSCKNESGIILCNLGLGLGNSNQGHQVVISGVKINISNPKASTFIISFIDPNTGQLAGQQDSKPNNIVIADDSLKRYELESSDFQLDVLYDKLNNRAMVSSPYLSQSMFTRLYFFDGRYTEHFKKFSEETSMTGDRVIVWSVDWNKEI